MSRIEMFVEIVVTALAVIGAVAVLAAAAFAIGFIARWVLP